MRRRDFIAGLAGTTALSRSAAAQNRVRVVGVVSGFSEAGMRQPVGALRARLEQLGWSDGRNLRIEPLYGEADYPRMTAAAGSLVGRNPDVIVTMGTPALSAVRVHTQSIPIVFTLVADPVRVGFVQSLARPGGHITGFTNFELSIGAKWLELLKDISPSLTHVTVLNNRANTTVAQIPGAIEQAGRAISVEVVTAHVTNGDEIEKAILDSTQQTNGGIIVVPDSLAFVNTDRIIGLAARHRLPAIYPFRVFAEKGGLAAYGLDVTAAFRQVADYVDRILRGAAPSELPVQAPNKFELIINLKTARALGISIPPVMLARADEVIE